MLFVACIATLALMPPLAVGALLWWGRRQRATLDGRVLVVLGAKVGADGTPSPALTRRLTVAATLNPTEPPVFCGGSGEAEAMATWWQRHAPHAPAPRLDRASTTTDENAQHAHALLGDVAVLLVTDDLHSLRARAAFRALFTDVALHHARTPGVPWRNGIRELGGWAKRYLRRAQASRRP